MIIIENIVFMAQKLGYEVICAEPKDEETAVAAYKFGCTMFTGDIYDKPLSERFFKRRLTNPEYNKN